MSPAETLRIWQPVIDLARKLSRTEDDPEDVVVDLVSAVFDAEDEEARIGATA